MHIGAQGARRSERQKTGQGSKKIHELLNAATYFFSSFRLIRHRLTLINTILSSHQTPILCRAVAFFIFFFFYFQREKKPTRVFNEAVQPYV